MSDDPVPETVDMAAAMRRWELRASPLTITRLSSDRDDLAPDPPNAPEDAFHIITQLRDFRLHRLWRGESLVFEGGHPKSALAITDLREEWRCHHLSPFDNVRFKIPFQHVRAFSAELSRPELSGFKCRPGTLDAVMLGLAQALLPALEQPQQASRLFLEQVGLAILTHLTQTYGGVYFPVDRKGTLAPWQEKRALELLAARLDGGVSIAELAECCDLSRSYFVSAFKASFGQTPARWLNEYRVACAKELLSGDLPIAEIAIGCGFADQSHLTKVFAAVTGETPARFRRERRSSKI